jgi:hypothetical protein
LLSSGCALFYQSYSPTCLFYIQLKNSENGIAHYAIEGYNIGYVKNNKIESLNKFDLNIGEKFKLIPYENEYILVSWINDPALHLNFKYDNDINGTTKCIYDKDMKKILRLENNVKYVTGSGNDLTVFFKDRTYAIMSLQQLIDSNAKPDISFKLPYLDSDDQINPYPIHSCVTGDKVVLCYNSADIFGFYILDRLTGDLIENKSFDFKGFPLINFFITSGDTLYWVDYSGEIYKMNLKTFEYRRIVYSDGIGIAVIDNKIFAIRKGRLIKELKDY